MAWLCVLLGHAWLVLLLIEWGPAAIRNPEELETAPITLSLMPTSATDIPVLAVPPSARMPAAPALEQSSITEAAAPSPAAITDETATSPVPGRVDWPLEGKRSAARVLAEEAEAERLAKMFAGPQGTWASLTRREREQLSEFRWRPGVDGLERDENGNTIYRLNSRCVLVNFVFIGCALGAKPPAYGDLFKDMKQYFDEQRRPPTHDGNGTEPESKRPPKWSKPLDRP